jgi:DNA-binding NarL/FixJ family response regulator
VLVLTMHHDDDSVFAAMRVGARGYVRKGASQQALVQAIQVVARGEAIFGPSVASRVLATSPAPNRPWPSGFQS